MVVVMKERATEAQIDSVIARLIELGMDVHRLSGATRTVLGVVGAHKVEKELIEILDGVHEVLRISEPYKRASRTLPDDTIVTIDDVRIGGDEVIMMAGPCSAETEEQVMATAAAVRRAGAKILRGGAFKPRSSPYSFQGLGEQGLQMLRRAADAHNLKLISEVMDISQIELIEKAATSSRSAPATCRTSRCCASSDYKKPVLLKRNLRHHRGVAAVGGANSGRRQQRRDPLRARDPDVRDRDPQHVRYLGDSGRQEAQPSSDRRGSEPRCRPPGHGAPMARAAAAGADGLIIEVHNDLDRALSDGAQSMFPSQFDRLMAELRIIAPAIGRSICLEPVSRRGWAR